MEYYYRSIKLISENSLIGIKNFLNSLDATKLIDVNSDYSIERSHPVSRQIFGIDFISSQVKYPLLIHKFGKYEIITEIVIKEKQYAVGVQPMLYFCFPVTELKSEKCILNRTAETKA